MPVKKRTLWRLLPSAAALLMILGLSACGAPAESAAAEVQTALITLSPEPEPTPDPHPFRLGEGGYFPAENGLFRPMDPLTRPEAAALFAALRTDDRPLPALDALEDGEDEGFTRAAFLALLTELFDPSAAADAVRSLPETDGAVTRADAAACLNRLLDVSPSAEADSFYWPDVPPTADYAADVLAAAGDSGRSDRLPEGYVNIFGWLYCVDGEGYFLQNRYSGSFYFDGNGRQDSGNKELDRYAAYVLADICAATDDRMEQLRAAFLYARDSFSYFRRNYYYMGVNGWQENEALTMLSTGRGNCYCYAGTFRALARGLGYEARAVSGTVGKNDAPHGWVEIVIDGTRYIFDAELEMAGHREGDVTRDMYMRDYNSFSQIWVYKELSNADAMLPRSTAVK